MKWVTRERPKIDRIACPWLIRRFLETDAEFLYRLVDQVATRSGARTSLFVPELDRLFVAERAGILGSEAAVLVFRPAP